MRPEDIQHRDFIVGLRGYDKDDVRAFLAEVAAEHAALLAELERPAPAAPPVAAAASPDEFENLGASVAAILRAARESATEMTAGASDQRAQAEADANEIRHRAIVETDELRSEARTVVEDAKVEAERIVRDAAERARSIEIEVEARISTRFTAATQAEAALRARMQEVGDGLQMVFAALDTVDLRESEAALGSSDAVSVDSGY